jgi:hypothetical protein
MFQINSEIIKSTESFKHCVLIPKIRLKKRGTVLRNELPNHPVKDEIKWGNSKVTSTFSSHPHSCNNLNRPLSCHQAQ